ncbi:MAG TPA: AAA family ATPase, partial [Nitrospirae bacterium]|nr:AAA family ATPase [Nitrospirota bacterium]
MDFLRFYGLNEEPFRLTPDPAYFYPSKSHNNGLLSMNYSAEQREGFCLIIGEPGTGKTTLLNVFLENWKDRAEIAMVLTPRLLPGEFLLAVLDDFGIPCGQKTKNDIIKLFRDFLIEKAQTGRGVIILVDEAQNLPDETLEELRLLSNLETEKGKLLHILLIGQPELLKRLNSPALRQLNQRIMTSIYLSPLNMNEIRDYISFRLTKAGRGHVRFSDSAIKAIYRYSKGIPRLINAVTTRTLMSAFLEESGEVNPKHVKYAAKSLDITADNKKKIASVRPAFILALVLATALHFAFPSIMKYFVNSSGNGTALETSLGIIHRAISERESASASSGTAAHNIYSSPPSAAMVESQAGKNSVTE